MYHRNHLVHQGGKTRSHGYPDLVRHVEFAQEHCNGEFRVILAGAVDPHSIPPKIAWCEPRAGIKLKIVSFDAETGELWADVIPAE
jgi:hypothetical protein